MTTILVIEDEAHIREEIVEVLTYENYKAIGAENGKVGIEKAIEHLPDFIICDVTMPVVNGFDVLSELQSIPETRSIPFIFLTALSHHNNIRAGMKLGADDYLTKPFSFTDLLNVIRTRLEKRQLQEMELLRNFSRHLVQSQDVERQRWAQRLKADIGEPMTQLRFLLTSLGQLAPETLQGSVYNINNLVGSIIDQLDSVQSDLWPTFIEHLGLVPALAWHINLYTAKHGITVDFQHEDALHGIPVKMANNVYFLVREALRNVATHAQVSSVTLYVSIRDGQIVGQVVDLGVGFDPDAMFANPKGYGLINAQERLRSLGGRLELIAAPDVGTTLRFYIPLDEAAQAQPATTLMLDLEQTSSVPVAPSETITADDRIDILVAEDHDLIRLGLQQIIESQADLQVSASAESGQGIINYLETHTPALLVLDLDLPPSNGLEVMGILQQQYPKLPVIVLSPTKESVFAWEALQRGAMGCVLKQAADTELIDAIRQVLNKQKYISPLMSTDVTPTYTQARRRTNVPKDKLNTLTPREREILGYVVQDHQNSEIADMLTISVRTVETHRANMMRKLDLHSKSELLRYALKRGITSLDQ